MRKKENPRIKNGKEKLLAFLSPKKRGEEFSHATLAGVCGFAPPDTTYYHIMKYVRVQLESTVRLSIKNLHCNGYRICTVEEQTFDEPHRQLRFAKKKIRRAERTSKSTPKSLLSMAQQRRRDATLQQMTQARLATHRAMVVKAEQEEYARSLVPSRRRLAE